MLYAGKGIVRNSSNIVRLAKTKHEGKGNMKGGIVMVHDLLRRRSEWDDIASRLVAMTGANVITVDLRDHGESPHTETFSFDLAAEDIFAAAKAEGWQEVLLVGHGLGGRTALHLGCTKQNAVVGVIAVNASPFPSQGHWGLVRLFRWLSKVPMSGDVASSRKAAEKILTGKFTPDGIEYIQSQIVDKGGKPNWLFNISTMNKSLDKYAELPKSSVFKNPTLFIGSTISDQLRPEDLDAILVNFPSARIVFTPYASHQIHKDQPNFLTHVISNFLLQKEPLEPKMFE